MEDFKQYVLQNVPTKILLKAFKHVRWAHYLGWPTDKGYYSDDWSWCDWRVRVCVGKFAYWNPNKGKSFEFKYTQNEVKNELDKREHINTK